MNVTEKAALVAGLTDRLKSARAIYVTDFVGLNVKAMTSLRAQLRAQGGQYLVVKNTLAERAMEGLDLPAIAEHFRGPTGLVIVDGDPIAPAKVLADFAKDHDQRPAIRAGIVERRAVAAADVQRLATLPGRDGLLGLLAGALEAPMAQFAHALEAKLVELAGLVDALRESRGG
jgi:large subunit ribosomal protein L10